MISFNKNQQDKIRSYKEIFLSYLESGEAKNDLETRNKRVHYYQQILPELINDLSEEDVERIITELWATRWFGNKQYLTQKIISQNGLTKLQNELKILIDTSIPATERYERALKEVKGIGPAYITEILTYLQPRECCIWNKKARDAIKILGLENYVNPDKYKLSATEYSDYNKFGMAILNEIKKMDVKIQIEPIDMLIVDFYLYVITETTTEKTKIAPKKTLEDEKDFDHDEIKDLTAEIGFMLGFESNTEVKVAHGSVVDVVWSTKIGNLGVVKYIFEVQKSGSTKGLLFNLLKAKKNPSVQKIIAISNEKQLKKIEKESEGLPEEFRRDLTFWQVNDVKKVAEGLQSAMEIISKLDLTADNIS